MEITNLIKPNTILSLAESRFLVSPLGDETVMMDTDNGDYIGINNVGSSIWNLLKQPMDYERLVANIMDEYVVPEEQCRKEILTFLDKMNEHKMLLFMEA
jgi:hypothetical protein